jgi:hypothetical protein
MIPLGTLHRSIGRHLSQILARQSDPAGDPPEKMPEPLTVPLPSPRVCFCTSGSKSRTGAHLVGLVGYPGKRHGFRSGLDPLPAEL